MARTKRALPPLPSIESSEEEMEEAEEQENPTSPDSSSSEEVSSGEDVKVPSSVSGSGSDSEVSDSESDPPMAMESISSMPVAPVADSSEKTPLFGRVWSFEDELALLNGALEYKSRTGVTVPQNFSRKLGGFVDFVKKSLAMDAVEGQIVDKLRRLKGKYGKTAVRSSPHFASPHDRTLFEISSKIWGGREPGAAAAGAAAGRDDRYPFIREAIAAEGKEFAGWMAWEKMDPTKARALEVKFKKQKLAVMKHHVHKIELQKETFKLIMDGIDRSR